MAFSTVSAFVALATAAISMSEAQRQQQQQEKAQRRNAAIAEQQAQLQEEEGRQARRDAYDAAQNKRRQSIGITAAQRAVMGASGAQVDQGSSLDNSLDTVEKGELDAFSIEEQGNRDNFGHQVQSWSLKNQAAAFTAKANDIASSGTNTQLNFMGEVAKTGSGFMNKFKRDGKLIP